MHLLCVPSWGCTENEDPENEDRRPKTEDPKNKDPENEDPENKLNLNGIHSPALQISYGNFAGFLLNWFV